MNLKSKEYDFVERLIKINPKITVAQVAYRISIMREFVRRKNG